jgi:crotonobetainyl-CoA:carnitine CoA-transferase CaiB-like acyl-CoA transferase
MVQTLRRDETDGSTTDVTTTRMPIRVDGERLWGGRAAPTLGADTEAVRSELAPASAPAEVVS